MYDRPSEQERTLIFGNGSTAELGDVKEDATKDEIIFLFRPSKSMRYRDRIPDEDYDPTWGWIVKSYPKDLCICVDYSPDFMVWWLFCDYYRKPCSLAESIDKQLMTKNEILKTSVEIWKKSAILNALSYRKAVEFPEEANTKLIERLAKQGKLLTINPLAQASEK